MRLVNPSGHSLELRLAAYQFPDLTGDDWDDNWLVVEGRVVHPDSAWTFSDASMTTMDAVELAGWLLGLAEGRVPPGSEMEFTEPNLLFQARNPGSLRVSFELEARPPWARPAPVRSNDMFLDFEPTPEDLRTAAGALRQDLERLPPRGAWAGLARQRWTT